MTFPLATHSLRRHFGAEKAVDGVDLDVAAGGGVHAVVGLNGAGKTTLMRLLLGMLRPDSGRATVLGHDVRQAPHHVWSAVGHLIETSFAYPELTVRENVTSTALLHGLTGSGLDAVDEVIETFELGHWSDRRASTLSLGNQQRLGLASALVHRPSVVVLDEPANALDPAGVVFVRDLLTDCAGGGSAVFVSSHHLDQLARVAQRITVLHRGRIVGALDPGDSDLEQRFFNMVHRHDLSTEAWG